MCVSVTKLTSRFMFHFITYSESRHAQIQNTSLLSESDIINFVSLEFYVCSNYASAYSRALRLKYDLDILSMDTKKKTPVL